MVDTDIRSRFSPQLLRHYRLIAGFSQADLSRAVGVQRPTVSHWEGGHWEPRVHMIVRMAKALDCDLEDLLDVPHATEGAHGDGVVARPEVELDRRLGTGSPKRVVA